MTHQCRHCRHPNTSRAIYCGRCGRPLHSHTPSDEPINPRPKIRCEGRPSGSLFLLGLIGVGALGIFWITKRTSFRFNRDDESRVERIFSLPSVKADAMFDLLKPDDVAVIVDRRRGGIYIHGTPDQVRTVEQFIDLLTRGCDDRTSRQDGIYEAEHHTIKRTYKLSRSKAKALFRTLAFQDLPVFASRSGSKVIVSARPEDQGTIDRIVRILGGRRYH